MKSFISPDFRKAYKKLPEEVRSLAKKNYRLWRQNPFHGSLFFKQLKKNKPYYSIRVGLKWRALGIKDGEEIIWFWIGPHEAYNNLIKQILKSF